MSKSYPGSERPEIILSQIDSLNGALRNFSPKRLGHLEKRSAICNVAVLLELTFTDSERPNRGRSKGLILFVLGDEDFLVLGGNVTFMTTFDTIGNT